MNPEFDPAKFPRRLNLGCGFDVRPGYLNVDLHAWHKPDLLATFAMAFLVNLLAYPFVLGLLPYAAKEVYGAGQAVLGYLAAAFWSGAR